MTGPFKTRKQLSKDYSFKKPKTFKKTPKTKFEKFIAKITGDAPFIKKNKMGGAIMKNRGGTFKGTY